MHHFLSVLLVIALCVTPAVATAETAIPLGRTGHAFHRGNASALTTVEYYIDLTCSSCRDSWSLLNKVYDTYKEKVGLLVSKLFVVSQLNYLCERVLFITFVFETYSVS